MQDEYAELKKNVSDYNCDLTLWDMKLRGNLMPCSNKCNANSVCSSLKPYLKSYLLKRYEMKIHPVYFLNA